MTLPIEQADYFIVMMHLPPKIYAFVRSNGDSTYTVYLDPRRDFFHRLDDYEHELWHIIHDDLFSDKSIAEIECL